jgi:hypothetical protein
MYEAGGCVRAAREHEAPEIGIDAASIHELVHAAIGGPATAIIVWVPFRDVEAVESECLACFGEGNILGQKSEMLGKFEDVLGASTNPQCAVKQVGEDRNTRDDQSKRKFTSY